MVVQHRHQAQHQHQRLEPVHSVTLYLFSQTKELQCSNYEDKCQKHCHSLRVDVIPGVKRECRYSKAADVPGTDGVEADEDSGAEDHEEGSPQPFYTPFSSFLQRGTFQTLLPS